MRYFNVYGKRQDPNGAYAAVIPKWITNALNDGDLPINGEGDQTRDFTYISDVVQMNINSLLCKKEEAFGKAYNVAFGHRISLQELAKSIIEITSSKSRIVNAPARKGDIKDSFADINLARKYLGYDPKNSFTSGLKKTIEWFKKNENY
jgi:UDP-N-acetylglucosamine 4-epimerase